MHRCESILYLECQGRWKNEGLNLLRFCFYLLLLDYIIKKLNKLQKREKKN